MELDGRSVPSAYSKPSRRATPLLSFSPSGDPLTASAALGGSALVEPTRSFEPTKLVSPRFPMSHRVFDRFLLHPDHAP